MVNLTLQPENTDSFLPCLHCHPPPPLPSHNTSLFPQNSRVVIKAFSKCLCIWVKLEFGVFFLRKTRIGCKEKHQETCIRTNNKLHRLTTRAGFRIGTWTALVVLPLQWGPSTHHLLLGNHNIYYKQEFLIIINSYYYNIYSFLLLTYRHLLVGK